MDMLYKTRYWQSIPLLPNVDIDLVKKVSSKIKIDNHDLKRNQVIIRIVVFLK